MPPTRFAATASSPAAGWPRGGWQDVIRYRPQVMTPFLTE
jgi:hypothetical protein